MAKIKSHMSMSVDGYIAGPDPSRENPLGTNGQLLHEWMFKTDEKEQETEGTLKSTTGAAIVGYNMYNEGLPHWGGGPLGDDVPTFVLATADQVPAEAQQPFTFVTTGVEDALAQAKAVAGDKDIWVGGGANTVQQCIKAGLLDELQLHIVPIVLGGGTPMFGEINEFMELNKTEVKDEPDVTHFTFRFTEDDN